MKQDIWRWIVGLLVGAVIALGSYGFSALESRVTKLETAPERLATIEEAIRNLRNDVQRVEQKVDKVLEDR